MNDSEIFVTKLRRILHPALAASLPLIVAACSTNPFLVTEVNCPAVSVVANTGTLSFFEGEERNAGDLTMNASISGVDTSCRQGEEGTELIVRFNIIGTRGPAMGEGARSIPLNYFVVLMRDNYQITGKQVYDVSLNFQAGETTAGSRETIRQVFDDISVARRYDYELLVGFQLTSDQLAYNILR